MKRKWRIPPMQGMAFKLSQGQSVRIIDVEGAQVADLVAYRQDDLHERLDPGVTMDALHKMKVKPGDNLYTNMYKPMFTIIADTVGQHDFLNPACRSEMYERLYAKSNHPSCYNILNEALAEFGIPAPDQHYPFNAFMNTIVHPFGEITIERPLSKPGDFITLRAEMDVIAAVSACPCSESACNGYQCTAIDLEMM
ncbi:urea carboxylase-associated family protein [Bacillus sp. 3255]|uniref:urea carboxylase-associated family protein n=1 Tax=Bacillus sp. 3255 TaxID=2817904 RepID=UPI00285A2F89|nr:urea carboxylase-associated family protein [Bacillus sp. 3255]MDR6885496.1 uncharacterized protein YcgI (DUF1989 family) [Bacillus sp. 3255]